MASPENQHCANCIGTLSRPISLLTFKLVAQLCFFRARTPTQTKKIEITHASKSPIHVGGYLHRIRSGVLLLFR